MVIGIGTKKAREHTAAEKRTGTRPGIGKRTRTGMIQGWGRGTSAVIGMEMETSASGTARQRTYGWR